MPIRLKPFDGRATHALSRTVGSCELGVSSFDALKFAKELIELRVTDFGSIKHVVTIVVVFNQTPQFPSTRGEIHK